MPTQIKLVCISESDAYGFKRATHSCYPSTIFLKFSTLIKFVDNTEPAQGNQMNCWINQ